MTYIVRVFQLCKQALAGNPVDFTKGDIKKAAFLVSFPSMLEYAMESLFVLIDLLYVSSLGEVAITLVGITNSIVILTQSFGMGISIAATALVARRVGSNNKLAAAQFASHSLYFTTFLGLLFGGFLFYFSAALLRVSDASAAIIQYGLPFTKLIFLGLVLVFLRIVLNGILRGYGKTYKTFRVMLILNGCNVVLCPIFLYGLGPIPAFGIEGIAYSSLLSNLASVLYALKHLIDNKYLLYLRKINYPLIKKIIKLAYAGTIQFLIPSTSRYFMIIIVAQLGLTVLTGYIIANRIVLFLALPAWGIANAAGVLVGQNLGANQPKRAEKSVWKIIGFNVIYLTINAVLLFIFARPIISFFSKDPEIIKITLNYLHYIMFAFLFFGFTMVITRALNASGAILTVSLLYIFMFYVTQLPLAYWLGIHLGWRDTGIFTAILVSELVLAVSCILVFKISKWQKIKI